MRIGIGIFGWCVLALVVVVAVAAAGETIELPADVPSKRAVELEEVWRLGGDDEGVLIGLVSTGVMDERGNVLLADEQLSHVLVVSPEGEVTATLGREGDGPGELRHISDVLVAGGRVGMVQEFPGKVVYVDRSGDPAGGFTLGSEEMGGHFSIRELCGAGSVLVGVTDRTRVDFDEDEAVTQGTLSVLFLDGAFGTELVRHEVARGIMNIEMDEAANWSEFSTWAAGPDGRVATADERDDWSIRVRDLAGGERLSLRRPFRARKRTEEEKEEAVSRMRLAVATGRSTIEKKALDTDPAILELHYASDGRLFVVSCHQAPDQLGKGVAGRFDIVSPEGELVEELTLVDADFDPEQDRLVFLDGTHFLILSNWEDTRKATLAAFLPPDQQEDLSDAEPLEVLLMALPR